MNVTLKIDDQLCREARHRAVDCGMSLSAWMTQVLHKELGQRHSEATDLLEALSMNEDEGRSFKIPRSSSKARSVRFSHE